MAQITMPTDRQYQRWKLKWVKLWIKEQIQNLRFYSIFSEFSRASISRRQRRGRCLVRWYWTSIQRITSNISTMWTAENYFIGRRENVRKKRNDCKEPVCTSTAFFPRNSFSSGRPSPQFSPQFWTRSRIIRFFMMIVIVCTIDWDCKTNHTIFSSWISLNIPTKLVQNSIITGACNSFIA